MNTGKSLSKTLTLLPAVGLAITMVVGSGMLVIPGLAYAQVGPAAFYTWLISAAAIGPVLIIFARLGAIFPNAGGIAGFVQAAFSRRAGAATEILILGAIPGGAAIAITGGQYFAALVHPGHLATEMTGTAIVLFLGWIANHFGAKLSGKIQQVLAFFLVGLLALVAISALVWGDHTQGSGIAPIQDWTQSFPAFSLVFFAFIGWEMMAFTSEEFLNPKRDFPRMIAISYIIVLVLYTLFAAAIQIVLSPNDPAASYTPVASMLAQVIGPSGARIIGAAGFFLVVANSISVVWAFSRLVFASAREGLLPQLFSRMETPASIPRPALGLVFGLFGLFSLAHYLGIFSQSLLFELAGLSFFFSYLLAITVFLKVESNIFSRILGGVALLVTLLLYFNIGFKTLYPAVLFLGGMFSASFTRPPK